MIKYLTPSLLALGLLLTSATVAPATITYPESLVRATSELAVDTESVRLRLSREYAGRASGREPRVRTLVDAVNTFTATTQELARSVRRNRPPQEIRSLFRQADAQGDAMVAAAQAVRGFAESDIRQLRSLRNRAQSLHDQVEAVATQAGGRQTVTSRDWTPVMWTFFYLGRDAANADRARGIPPDYQRHARNYPPLLIPYFAAGYQQTYPDRAYRPPVIDWRTPPRWQWTPADWSAYERGWQQGNQDRRQGRPSDPTRHRVPRHQLSYFFEGYYEAYPPPAGRW